MLVLIIGLFVVVGLIFQLINDAIDSAAYKKRAEIRKSDKNYQIKKRKEEGGYIFHRLNDVEGRIKVNGRVYKTFNSGSLTVSGDKGSVEIELWTTLNECYLGDIYMNDIPVREGMPNLSSLEEEIEYLTGLFNMSWSAGMLSANTVQGAKEILRDFQKFAYLLRDGEIAEIPGTEDYVWMGEIKAKS